LVDVASGGPSFRRPRNAELAQVMLRALAETTDRR
jgi:hypothetical protein